MNKVIYWYVSKLTTELKPKGVVVNMIPGLPAYIIFMCVRHADYLSDEVKLKSLMNAVIGGVKRVIMVRLIVSLRLSVLWAVNITKQKIVKAQVPQTSHL